MASASTQPPEMRHRVKVRILVILASVLAFLAIFTSWIDQQLLDTNEWVHTSGRLLEDKEISDAVATYSVDQLYANVDVTRLIKNRLPGDLQQLASPASAGIREIATRAAMRAFQSQRVQNLWQDANRVAHTQLVAILEDKHAAISSQNGKVVLDLKPIVYQLADRLGFKKQVANAVSKGEQTGTLKPGFGQLEIADSKELDTARTVDQDPQGTRLVLHDRLAGPLRPGDVAGQGPRLGHRPRLRPRPDRGGTRGIRDTSHPQGPVRRFAGEVPRTPASRHSTRGTSALRCSTASPPA